MPVHVLKHPLINAKLSVLRQSGTSNADFRAGIHDIASILAIESTRELEEEPFHGVYIIARGSWDPLLIRYKKTPVGEFIGSTIKPRIGLAPIMRAGHGMTDALLRMFPDAHVYHLGLFREKVSLQPVEYYSKLPSSPTVDTVFLLDPLVATGGTAVAAINMILDWGLPIASVKFLVVLASQEGLDAIQEEFPELEIWVSAVDPKLTDKGYISPGLGDTGDRLFNTPTLKV